MMLDEIIDVVEVRVLSRYILELIFENGDRRVIDLEGYLWGPVFEPLKDDYALFLQVRVDPELGTLVWPTGADLSPTTLYRDSRLAVPRAS